MDGCQSRIPLGTVDTGQELHPEGMEGAASETRLHNRHCVCGRQRHTRYKVGTGCRMYIRDAAYSSEKERWIPRWTQRGAWQWSDGENPGDFSPLLSTEITSTSEELEKGERKDRIEEKGEEIEKGE